MTKMPKQIFLSNIPKDRPLHDRDAEKEERTLRKVANDNEMFFELAANDVSLIQSGIKENVARFLTRFHDEGRETGDGRKNPIVEVVREERITRALYDAVLGNEMPEDRVGEDDFRNYEDSATVEHNKKWLPGRMINQVRVGVRGLGAIMQKFNPSHFWNSEKGKNFIEAKIEERFGGVTDLLPERNAFLAKHLETELEELKNNDLLWRRIEMRLGVRGVKAVSKKLGRMSIEELGLFREWLGTNLGAESLHDSAILEGMMVPMEKDVSTGRRIFVARKLEKSLKTLSENAQGIWQALRSDLGLPTSADNGADLWEVIEELAISKLSTLRRIADNPQYGLLTAKSAFRDLVLLVSVEQKETYKMTVDEVYDHETLRKFWSDLRGPELDGNEISSERRLTNLIDTILEANSLFPLKDNVDGKAFLAEIKARLEGGEGVEELTSILGNIAATETSFAESDPAKIKNNAEARIELQQLTDEARDGIEEVIKLRDEYIRFTQQIGKPEERINEAIHREVGALEAEKRRLEEGIDRIDKAVASPTLLQQDRDSMARERREIVSRIGTIDGELTDLKVHEKNSRKMAGAMAQITKDIEKAKNLKDKLENQQDIMRNMAHKIEQSYGIKNILGGRWGKWEDIINYFQKTDFLQNLNTVPDQMVSDLTSMRAKIEKTAGELTEDLIKVKTTPFVLLQRLMRRDYCEINQIAHDVYSDEANHYGIVKARLRVQEVENVDFYRSINDKAAKYKRRHAVLKGWDRIVQAVAAGQEAVGLELFNIRDLSADSLIEQIVKSEAEFAVFKGVNKFTTTRDLRDILNKSGQNISQETLEAFARMLMEAINKFKKVPPHLYKGLNYNEWDLEQMVTVVQKLKAEMWSRDFLERLSEDSNGVREHVVVAKLKEARKKEQKSSEAIKDDIQDPEALWRIKLNKAELKKIVDPEGLEKWVKEREKMKKTLVDEKAKPGRDSIEIDKKIAAIDRRIKAAKKLNEDVREARELFEKEDMSKAERNKYLELKGLALVFAKLGTNFMGENGWKITKKAGKRTKGWAGRFWNETLGWEANKKALKSSKVVSVAALPVRAVAYLPMLPVRAAAWGLGGLWGLVKGVARAPKRIVAEMSDGVMRNYLRDRMTDVITQKDRLEAKQEKLKEALAVAPYFWDKNRIARKLNKLEGEKKDLDVELAEFEKIAKQRKIDVGLIVVNKYAIDAGAEKKPGETKK